MILFFLCWFNDTNIKQFWLYTTIFFDFVANQILLMGPPSSGSEELLVFNEFEMTTFLNGQTHKLIGSETDFIRIVVE